MDESVQKFAFTQANEVRVVTFKDKQYFVAKDVCDILGLRTDNVKKIVGNQRVMSINPYIVGDNGRGHGKDIILVSESGLYKLVLKSRKKEAVKFQDWVTDELLPTIRRQGYYVMEGRIAELEKSLRKSEEQRELMSRSIATYTPWKDMPEGGHTRRGSNVKPAETAQLPTTDGRHYRNAIRKAVKSRIIEDWVLDQFRMSIEVDLIKGTKHTKNEERLLSLLAIHAITVQVTIGA